MKNLKKHKAEIIAILMISYFFFGFLTSCKKKENTYELNFEATHWVSEDNQFANPYAYYDWSVTDENYNEIYDESGIIESCTVKGNATAKTGDWIWIYISVNDAFCNGTVSCKSTDGEIYLFTSTDNMFIAESNELTVKSVNINGVDTVMSFTKKGFKIN